MKSDLKDLLDRQAAWQRARSAETWAERLRTAVVMRQALLAIRKPPANPPEAAGTPRE